MVKVSVCMITYNHEKFIERATQSVLEQDVNFDYEVVVGDDCSTDTTAPILRELERKNQNRLRVIYRPANLGSKANFLNTLAVCKGEYVAFLDGDDCWTSNNKLQLQVDFLNRNQGVAGVFHRTTVINGELIGLPPILPAVEPPEFFSLDFFFRNSNQFSVSSLLARRVCLSNIGAWLAHVRPGDWALFMMLATQGDLGFIPLEMSHYRVHATGTWNRLSQHHRAALVVQMLEHVMELVSGKNKELIESVKSLHANWWCSEIVANSSVSVKAVTHELNEIADFRLSNYLLAQVVAIARAKGQADEDQARDWEAAAARASSDAKASEAAAARASSDAKAWEAVAARVRSDASDALNASEQLRCTVQELHGNAAELQSENDHLNTLISKHERDSQRTGWLLKHLGDKFRHFPRDLSRRIRASRKKRLQ
jgi:glycosyltransferase involved in cell wall biosynthesis